MFWNWLTEFFTAPARVQELEKTLMGRNIMLDEVRNKLAACQSEKSRMFSELNLAIKDNTRKDTVIQDLKIQMEDKDVEIQALKDSQTSTDKDNQIQELQATALRRQGTINNLTEQRDKLLATRAENYSMIETLQAKLKTGLDLTPENLTASLKVKYPDGNAEAWDKFDLALINAFALPNDGEFKILTQSEFLQRLSNAFPNAKFISEPLDNEYYAPTMDFAEKAVRNDYGNLKTYAAEKWDCDKFAEDLRVYFRQVYGYNTGVIVLGDSPFGYHAWILVVCFDGIVMVEPQSDSMTRIPNILEGYVVRKFHTY